MGSKESDTTEQLSLFVLFSTGRIHIRSRKVLVVQLCPTFCDLIDRRSPGCPWDFPGKATGVGCHFLPQGIFLTQGSNPGLLHFRQILYHLSHQGSSREPNKEKKKKEITPNERKHMITFSHFDKSMCVSSHVQRY